jgi:hypothetical protein
VSVELKRGATNSIIGLMINANAGHPIVTGIAPNSAASACACLVRGDILIDVNSKVVLRNKLPEIVAVLKEQWPLNEVLHIQVLRADKDAERAGLKTAAGIQALVDEYIRFLTLMRDGAELSSSGETVQAKTNAARTFASAIHINPRSAPAYFNFGIVAWKLSTILPDQDKEQAKALAKKALSSIEQAVILEPEDTHYWEFFGLTAQSEKRADLAWKAFSRLQQLDPTRQLQCSVAFMQRRIWYWGVEHQQTVAHIQRQTNRWLRRTGGGGSHLHRSAARLNASDFPLSLSGKDGEYPGCSPFNVLPLPISPEAIVGITTLNHPPPPPAPSPAIMAAVALAVPLDGIKGQGDGGGGAVGAVGASRRGCTLKWF